ncbi:MAG: hypothetical protein ACOY4N_11045 [Pseudomonadota bacterium]
MANSSSATLESIASPGLAPLVQTIVGAAIRAKAAFDCAEDDQERARRARHLLAMLIQATNVIAGPDVLEMVYGESPPADADPRQHLAALSMRLWVASEVFKGVEDTSDPSSITSLRDEVLAVANGDSPRLLSRAIKSGRGVLTNGYRLALHRLRALEWEQFLQSMGQSPAEVQGAIVNAYNFTWSAIRGWREQVDKALGAQLVSEMLMMAKRRSHPAFLGINDIKAAHEKLKMDANEMKLEGRRSGARKA